MALDLLNSGNSEQLALKGLIKYEFAKFLHNNISQRANRTNTRNARFVMPHTLHAVSVTALRKSQDNGHRLR